MENLKEIDFSSSATFRIAVKGVVDKKLSDYLNGLSIRYSKTSKDYEVSYLEGVIIDQAALIGILNTLYDLRYTILNVEIIR